MSSPVYHGHQQLSCFDKRQIFKTTVATTEIEMIKTLPLHLQGTVVHGFGRGSKELGMPTANFDEDVVKSLPPDLPSGIYFGWAQVDSSRVYPMVMSIGWNPFFKNEKRSVETHIMHEFENNFYGSVLKVVALGHLRPEKNFISKEELIAAIKSDIDDAGKKLKEKINSEYQNNEFFAHSKNDATHEVSSRQTDRKKSEDSSRSFVARM